MLDAILILAIVLVAATLAPALAHAFEFPGKKRLGREAYLSVQTIYYPGFTLLGMAEPASLIAVIVLLLLTPPGTAVFWLTLVALAGLLGMQIVYWALIHPVNKYWLQSGSVSLGTAGAGFFAVGGAADEGDWTKFRDRWEYSHIARAGMSFLSFLALIFAAFVRC